MTLEHKIGIGITCTFLCLTGAVIGLKLQEKPLPEALKVAAADAADSVPHPIKNPNIEIPIKDNLDSQSLEYRPPAPQGNASGDTPRPPLSFDSPKQGDKNENPIPPANARKNEDKPSFGKNATPNVAIKTNPAVNTSSPQIEPSPTAAPVQGANQWGTYSNDSKDKKQGTLPAGPPSGTSPALPPFPEGKKTQPANPAASPVVLTSGSEPPKALADTQTKSPPAASGPIAPPSPQQGNVTAPIPPAPAPNSTNSATSPMMAMPSYISQPSTNAPKLPDPKEKVAAPLSPTPAQTPVKTPDLAMPATPPIQAPVTPPVAPAIVSPAPPSPPPVPPPSLPSGPAQTSAPPLAPMPVLVGGSGTTGTPPPPASPVTPPTPPKAPADGSTFLPVSPTATPPAPVSPVPLPTATPPKPPADGSSFVPDNSPTANGPVGVKPAPLPLPVMPSSSPLASTPDKLAPTPQPVSKGPSVTVYDEQDYSSRAGDTWEALSKQFYMTDRYAKALQRHNQNHARASDRMKDNGQLAQGERVFVPQAYVLEDRYADAIPKATVAPASATMPATFVAPSGSPPPPPPPPAPLPPGNGTPPPPLSK